MDAPPINGSLLWRRRWTVLAATAIVTAAALFASSSRTPVYTSTAQVLVGTLPQAGVEVQPNMDNEKRIADSLGVAQEVAAEYRFGVPPDVMLRSLSVDVPVNTDILAITYAHTDPHVAEVRAQAFADTYVKFRTAAADEQLVLREQRAAAAIAQLQRKLDDVELRAASGQVSPQLQTVLNAEAASYVAQLGARQQDLQALRETPDSFQGRVIAAAQLSTAPARPNHLVDGAVGVLVGLLLGIGLALAQDRTDRRPRSNAEVEELLAVPVLGSVPVARSKGVASATPYRQLAARIVLAAGAEPSRLAIAHCTARQRGRVPAVELARAWASRHAQLDGKPVVLVRADDSLAQDHIVRGLQGLSDLLRYRGDADGMGFQVEGGVEVIPLGTTPLRPEDLVPVTKVRAALDRIAELGAPVIIDAPPVLSGLAGEMLPAAADTVVVVVDPRSVTRDEIVAVRSALDKASVRLVGAVTVTRRRTKRLSHNALRLTRGQADGAIDGALDEHTAAVTAR
jgi:succinoglycan biosynthesis transport protein ExoP